MLFRPAIENDVMPIEDEDDDRRRWIMLSCEKHGLSVTELAHRSGIAPSTLTRFLKGGPGTLSGRTLQRLRSAVAALSPENAGGARSSYPHMSESNASFEVRPVSPKVSLLNFELSADDVKGPDGSLGLELIHGDFDRLKPLPGTDAAPASRIFAFYMPGDFMRPRFRTGECVLVDQVRPAPIGSEVLITFVSGAGEPGVGTIAELVERDRSQMRFRQSQDRTLATIHRSEIKNVFAIVGCMRIDITEADLNLDLGRLR